MKTTTKTEKVTFQIERWDSKSWAPIGSDYKAPKAAIRAFKRAQFQKPQNHYRIAWKTEVTTTSVSVMVVIRAFDEQGVEDQKNGQAITS